MKNQANLQKDCINVQLVQCNAVPSRQNILSVSLCTLHIGFGFISGQNNDVWQHSGGLGVFPQNWQDSHCGWRTPGSGAR